MFEKPIYVRPRVTTESSSTPILLVDALRALAENNHGRPVAIVGGPGSGKSTAIDYLWTVETVPNTVYIDSTKRKVVEEKLKTRKNRLVVFTAGNTNFRFPATVFHLAPWTTEECFEYANRLNPESAAAAVATLGPELADLLEGSPQACRWAVEKTLYAKMPQTCRALLHQRAMRACREAHDTKYALQLSLETAFGLYGRGRKPGQKSSRLFHPHDDLPFLCRLRAFADFLIAHYLHGLLVRKDFLTFPLSTASYRLLDETANLLASDNYGETLTDWLTETGKLGPGFALSLLHKLGYHNRVIAALKLKPYRYLKQVNYSGAILDELSLTSARLSDLEMPYSSFAESIWEKVNLQDCQANAIDFTEAKLTECDITRSDLSESDWERAQLRDCYFGQTNFKQAEFPNAVVRKTYFRECAFEKADFRSADFSGSKFRDCDFFEVKLKRATFFGCDFQGSRLQRTNFRLASWDGSKFSGCNLKSCNMEALELTAPDFSAANLSKANLTNSKFSSANFHHANLSGAMLAKIDWSGANLCSADLRQARFHLGSTRSGLVGSPIASHGSRTGFYTDEYLDQTFKNPDEIRVANLRGADLRGAQLDKTDLYLVDLRDALLDPIQRLYAMRCRAIL